MHASSSSTPTSASSATLAPTSLSSLIILILFPPVAPPRRPPPIPHHRPCSRSPSLPPSQPLPFATALTAAPLHPIHCPRPWVCSPAPTPLPPLTSSPPLLCAGVLLEHSNFGLERDIGPDLSLLPPHPNSPSTTGTTLEATSNPSPPSPTADLPASLPCWSLFDDLYFNTVTIPLSPPKNPTFPPMTLISLLIKNPISIAREPSKKPKRQWIGPVNAHLASGS